MKTFATGVAVVMLAGVASAQTPRTEADAVKARQKVSMMEGVLERAVANGADNVLRQMREIVPVADSPLMLMGQPHVRGFRLDGYGVFFDVEVPALRLSMAWALRYMVDQNGVTAGAAVADLRSFVAQQARDPRDRERLERSLQRIEAQVGPAVPRPPGVGAPAGAATRVAEQVPSTSPGVVGPGLADSVVIDDPNEAFTREVKEALVEAMIENSGPITIGPEEYLAVAARDNARTDRLAVPSDAASDLHTIMIRVKGSDLAAFREGRITMDEARKRVQVREY